MEWAITNVTDFQNPDLGDMRLGDDNQEVLLTTLADEVAQRLGVRFRFLQGEWFLNLLAGAPYYQYILGQKVSDRVVRAFFSTIIVQTEGVASVDSLTYEISATRRLSLTFRARLEDGTVFSTETYGPYVVDLTDELA